MLFGKWQGGIEFLGAGACANGEKRRHARGARAFKHSVTIFRELREVNVCV
jgi:hypothetical protein